MRIIKSLQLISLALIFALGGCSEPKEWVIKSPDNKISFKVYEEENLLFYTVDFSDTLVIGESPLGIARNDAQFIEKLSFLSESQLRFISEDYTLLVGKQLECKYSAKELVLTFENEQKAKIELVLRAGNDGVAFRYRFPENATGNYEITNEITGFKFAETGKAWIEPYDSITKYSPGYERNFTNGTPVGESSPEAEGWCFAGLFQTSNAWVLLTEAGLDGSFCGSRLAQSAPKGLYSVRYPDEKEAMGLGNANPQSKDLPWATPWRVIMIAKAPCDIIFDPALRSAEFDKLQKWGVKWVKVDFFQSDKQHIIQQYMGILKDAADFHVMVNFHGCTLPRGWQRTWPNLVGMESVPGEECYMFRSTYPETAVWNNTILPFTRNVVGSMDYTPFGLTDKVNKHLTTYSNELALTVVFESGVVHLVDFPEVYKALPEYVQSFVKQLPTVWDESKMIYGYPGRDVVMARRSGEKWFIGGINGEMAEKAITLDFDFLTEGKSYTAKMITDGADGKSFLANEISVKKGDRLPVKMLPAGGFSAVVE